MATTITPLHEKLIANGTMATYNHMEGETETNSNPSKMNSQSKNMIWSVILEETLIACLTLALIWISIS